MNKSEFITLIEHPENLEKVHVQALKEIITDFPYLQHAHSILAKALFNQKHYEFEKQLKHTALMVPDREVLYTYIHDLQPAYSQAEVSVLPEVSLPVSVEETIITETIEEIVVEEIKIEENISAVEIIEATIEEKEEPLILSQYEPITKPEPSELSFFEWLNYANKEDVVKEEKEIQSQEEFVKSVPNIVEPFIEVPEFMAIAKENTKESITLSKPLPQPEALSNINQFDNILDKFIRENPSISRPKSAFYSPMNMAKQSAEEDEELVTETLANIYYKQGHYKKAIRAYEKLCLIYPHKMAYFATLIQKIKTENKD